MLRRYCLLGAAILAVSFWLAGCGGEVADGQGDCTLVVTIKDQRFEGYGSTSTRLKDTTLGTARIQGCGDVVPTQAEAWSIRGYRSSEVLGLMVGNRLDLYFRQGLSEERINQILEETP